MNRLTEGAHADSDPDSHGSMALHMDADGGRETQASVPAYDPESFGVDLSVGFVGADTLAGLNPEPHKSLSELPALESANGGLHTRA